VVENLQMTVNTPLEGLVSSSVPSHVAVAVITDTLQLLAAAARTYDFAVHDAFPKRVN